MLGVFSHKSSTEKKHLDSFPFSKAHGGGNDMILLDGRHGIDVDLSELAQAACDRHYGIGSDGLCVLVPSTSADWGMLFFNPDGSRAICVNGMRCLSRFICRLGVIDDSKSDFLLETDRGVVHVHLYGHGAKKGERSRTAVGAPMFEGEQIPVAKPGEHVQIPLEVHGHQFTVTCVGMGNPHCVIFCDDVDAIPLREIGPRIEHHPFFPKRTNVEFVQVVDRKHVRARVWERGAGETLACGSGWCAVIAACVKENRTDRAIKLLASGLDFELSWDAGSDVISLTGPVEDVFDGTLNIPHLLASHRARAPKK